ncbi:MAG: ferrous iron transport protein B [Clostridiales bacterium]|nr:ferrous iron transport protein B [Clostridiales bacterium]
MQTTFALAGNQNSGKTTLFNRLTGSDQHVGNWPGVTVEKKTGRLLARYGGKEQISILDLPGAYSLSPHSLEERVTREALLSGKPDVVINVVDATHLERNLYLTLQLIQLGRPVVVALNMIDQVRLSGSTIDIQTLERGLGTPVVAICARTGEGVEALVQSALALALRGHPAAVIHHEHPYELGVATAESCYRKIETLLARCYHRGAAVRSPQAVRRERMINHPALALPLFLAAMMAVFLIAFGPFGSTVAEGFGAFLDNALAGAAWYLNRWNVTPWLRELIVDGILSGVVSVLGFLPTILLLFLMLSVLEDCGYMARAAFLMDRPLRKVGLNGRSFISLLMGFGCTVPAVMSARSMNNRRDRCLTILLTPFMSCGAKAPIYALFAHTFFGGHELLVTILLYLMGIAAAVCAGMVLNRTAFQGEAAPFLMELPAYRLPTLGNVLRQVWHRIRDFLSRVFTVIVLVTAVVWFLRNFTVGLRPAHSLQASLLGRIAGGIAPLLCPCGFGNVPAVTALLTGVMAKESVVSTLMVLCGAEGGGLHRIFPDVLSAVSFLVFVLLYTPCVAAVATMSRELDSKRTALLAAFSQTALAWMLATLIYQLGRLLTG